MIHLVAWCGWLLAILIGCGLFFLRSTETGFSYVSLPRLFYFLWVMVCVLVLAAMRAPYLAGAGLALAAVVGVGAFMGNEPGAIRRRAEVSERLEGCRRALEKNERNPASLELIGDVYSTLEEADLALRYWERANEIMPQTKLREKIAGLQREVPSFHFWGAPCAHEVRACPKCEAVGSRLDFSCRCGARFFPGRITWLAVRFNRLCDGTGAGRAIGSGLVLLPFLYMCAPWAYAIAWMVWIGARRSSPTGAA